MPSSSTWQRYVQYRCALTKPALELDISRMTFSESFLNRMAGPMKRAFAAMNALEAGAIANPTEGRMVGHYWLRKPALARKAPGGAAIARQITRAQQDIRNFAKTIKGRFTDILLIGIGGSALGPQFIADALGPVRNAPTIHFFDNTDPIGFQRTLHGLLPRLKTTLTIVISKSGGTPETHNGMIAAQQAYKRAKVDFAARAVAVTGEGSKLDRHAVEHKWLARFPMWDWVGGRTSIMGPVGLLPMALLGFDTDAFLKGAADCDQATRVAEMRRNPAALLALMWYHGTNGRGEKDMVVLPYRDRLQLFSRYLQQLVMESLGKRTTADGKRVLAHPQGIAVYGNKGSTDQHAYVQQLRDGVNNFFATFIESLEDDGADVRLETKRNGATAGDYLGGFLVGTRRALWENGRQSITITVPRVDAYYVGALIALYERAVGFYATLVGINAYDQPGVEAGKKAAAAVLRLQRMVLDLLAAAPRAGLTVDQIRRRARYADDVPAAERVPDHELAETVWKIARRLAANGRLTHRPGKSITQDRYASATKRA